MESEIIELEEKLRRAMLTSDVQELDRLISDELIYTGPDGGVLDKSADLAAHGSGKLKIHKLEPSERRIYVSESTAVVNVRMDLSASYEGQNFGGSFRYTRTWIKDGTWKIVAAHASQITGI